MTLLQISDAIPPALPLSQALNWVVFPLPSHSTVLSAANAVIIGAVVSTIVNVAEVVVKLPESSVAVKITWTAPAPPQELAIVVKSLVQVTSLQLSVAKAEA